MHRYGGAVFLKHARSCLRSNFYLEKANIVFLKYKLIKSHIKGHKKNILHDNVDIEGVLTCIIEFDKIIVPR
jgi:poly-beta-hydroxyalkanoate depolymerase